MSRLSTVDLYRSGLQGTPPNLHRQADQCELDSYNCGLKLSHSCNRQRQTNVKMLSGLQTERYDNDHDVQ